MNLLEKNLRKLPPLPAAILYLAWGATQIRNIDSLKNFSRKGLFRSVSPESNSQVNIAS
jgi:hypothetical protein